MEPCFCVIVFVLGTFQEGHRQVEGTQPPLGLPGGWILIKLLMSARQHAVASILRVWVGKKRISNLTDALWTASHGLYGASSS